MESVISKLPRKKDGSPLPWMNYNTISFLEARLSKDLSLFEYGSGSSTLFYADLVGEVVSVEDDLRWYNRFKDQLPSNVKLIHYPQDDKEVYVESIGRQGRNFDVVIVDGSHREACVLYAQQYLSDKGVIIRDDTQGAPTRPEIEQLCSNGFKRLDFEGLKPGGIRAFRTTILYRSNNCLGI